MLTEKMLEKVREQLATSPHNGGRFTQEMCVKAYLEHGTFKKAAEALGCSYQTMLRKVHMALEEQG